MADVVMMTYREIAASFGLSSADAARVKAKRKGWRTILGNHPGAAAMVEVPADALPNDRGELRTYQPPIIAPPSAQAAQPAAAVELRAQIALLLTQAERDRAAVDAMRLERDEAGVRLSIVEDELRRALERAARSDGELIAIRRRGWLARLLG